MNKKFTLVELLIVIAIIGMLVSILLPSIVNAKEKAKVAVCLSNQKQLAIAYHAYAAQNNQVAVAHTWYNNHSGTQGTHMWGNHPEDERPLNKYLSDPLAGHCPSDKGDPSNNWNDHEGKVMGSSFLPAWTGGTMQMFKHSTNVGVGTKHVIDRVTLMDFDRTDRKSIFHNLVLRSDRDWNNSNGKGKWHKSKDPRFTVGFVDGHAEYFNFWWKKTSNYDPVKANGKKDDLDWIIDNVNIY